MSLTGRSPSSTAADATALLPTDRNRLRAALFPLAGKCQSRPCTQGPAAFVLYRPWCFKALASCDFEVRVVDIFRLLAEFPRKQLEQIHSTTGNPRGRPFWGRESERLIEGQDFVHDRGPYLRQSLSPRRMEAQGGACRTMFKL